MNHSYFAENICQAGQTNGNSCVFLSLLLTNIIIALLDRLNTDENKLNVTCYIDTGIDGNTDRISI